MGAQQKMYSATQKGGNFPVSFTGNSGEDTCNVPVDKQNKPSCCDTTTVKTGEVRLNGLCSHND
jgi:hypothetical protein